MDKEEKEEVEILARTLRKCERRVGQVMKANKMKSKQTHKQPKKNPKRFGSLNYEQVRGSREVRRSEWAQQLYLEQDIL